MPIHIEIVRTIDTGKETLGSLAIMNDDKTLFVCKTLELTWKDNQHGISCIPKGTYKAALINYSVKIPYLHIGLLDVPNRDGICIHRANYVSELRGCIAVGMSFSDMNKDKELDLTNSKVTLDKIISLLPYSFDVVIK